MAELEDAAVLVAGRYRLIEQVGSGGMGTVWRGKDEVLGRTVAVKQLTGHIGVSATLADEAVQRAMREARIAARLHHPNVIGIYDVVEEDDRPYLVMEFLDSRSLSDILVDGTTLPIRELARIGAQVAAALTAAHEAGIVHRDVKPGNVLLADDGTVKLTDFGIARADGDKTVTAAGALVGTVAYMAPEVGLGQVADQRSDVYSLGATLYTAIEGEPPSGYDENPIALLYRIVHEDITPPQRAGELAPLLTWMLKRDPIHRMTMRQAQRALERIAEAPDARDATEAGLAVPAMLVEPDQAAPAADQAAEPVAPQDVAQEAAADAVQAPETPDAEAGTPSDAVGQSEAEHSEAAPEPVSELESASAAEPKPASGGRPGAVAAALGGRRRQVLIGAAAAAVVAVIVVIALLTTDQGGKGNAGAAGAQASTSRSAAARHSPTPAQSSGPASPSPSLSPSPSPSPSQDIAQQLSSTISDYYAMMPGDLSVAWTWLTASYQQYPARGWSGYTSYWDGMKSVTATNVTAQPPDSVTATITYYEKDGTVTTEVTEFGLVMQGGQWKINTSSVIPG